MSLKGVTSVAGLTESRITGSGELHLPTHTIYFSGGTTRVCWVSLAVRNCIAAALLSWHAVSDRLLSARFKHRHGAVSFLVAYAPTEVAESDAKDEFYGRLGDLLSAVLHNELFVLGDFNATPGQDRLAFEDIFGCFGFGNSNDNTLRLLTLCSSYGLHLTSTYFRRKKIYTLSWYSNDGYTNKELDHILTRELSSVKSYRVFRGLEGPANFDLFPVIAVIKIHPFQRRPLRKAKLNIHSLSDPEVASRYSIAVQNRFAVLESCTDVEEAWCGFRNTLLSVAHYLVPQLLGALGCPPLHLKSSP